MSAAIFGLRGRRRFRGASERSSAGDGWFGSAMSPFVAGRVGCAPLQAAAADNRLRTVRNSSWKGWFVSITISKRRTPTRTHAAISSGSRRRLPHVAAARRVWARRRWAQSSTRAIDANRAGGVGWRACRAPRRHRRTGRVGVLDAVLHLAALAAEVFVQTPGIIRAGGERGDGEARIGLAMGPFRLADDAAFAAPTVARGLYEVREAPRRGGALPAIRLGRRQTVAARQAEQVIHPVGLAPRYRFLAREPRIGPQHDPCVRPPRPQQGHDPRSLLHSPGRPVDVRRAQPRRRKAATAQNVQRRAAIAVVIAVEKPTLLRTVNRIVRRVEIQTRPLRSLFMRIQEQRHRHTRYRRAVMDDLAVPGRRQPPNSRRFSVDFPATGAQFRRFARNFPARTAIIGSPRNASRSIESSSPNAIPHARRPTSVRTECSTNRSSR